jgi:hypothetical protein
MKCERASKVISKDRPENPPDLDMVHQDDSLRVSRYEVRTNGHLRLSLGGSPKLI